ncbi:hypothetical protein GGS23DRAFT_597358 [Durotheca rogersii]|uniref:uncharacterized protein n=1 Tax=Durotheca rogersii TaxID=419775 RepID=UPI00221F744C|nr:uncharacterized protein GGS23DRAFT_597358 [Durotheca rogersii]KAI5862558.1 hypothetical protein GGS23DRAFT_597358 [Durotheca rogersii]
MAWKWVSKDDSFFEALLEDSTGISDAGKSAVMLRLCLGSIRGYAGEMVTMEETGSVISSVSDLFSDDDGDDDGHSDLSEGVERNGESNIDDEVGRKRGAARSVVGVLVGYLSMSNG